MPIANHSYASNYLLQLDGQSAGIPLSLSGGSITAMKSATPGMKGKPDLGTIVVTPVSMDCGTEMAKPFYDWVKSSCGLSSPAKKFTVQVADASFNLLANHTYNNATISQISFPECDAASKTAAKMSLQIASSSVTIAPGSGKAQMQNGAYQKLWISSNFQLKITGLEDACRHVIKVGGIVVGRGKPNPSFGITMTAAGGAAFMNWFKTGGSKGGSLTYLDPSLRAGLFQLNFDGLQLDSVSEAADLNPRNPVSATLRCGRMSLNVDLSIRP